MPTVSLQPGAAAQGKSTHPYKMKICSQMTHVQSTSEDEDSPAAQCLQHNTLAAAYCRSEAGKGGEERPREMAAYLQQRQST